MPVHQSLVDLNPDKLFEEHTVAEIKEIHKKLQAEIERKRVEIRTMVGERYRDLIQAADTISDMKGNSQGVISHIEGMSGMCQQLQQVHLLGFKQQSEANKHLRQQTSASYHAVVVQVRVLVLIPEQIWSALDQQNFLLAAQLYLLASNITNGLKLNIGVEGSSLSGDKVLGWFPVISHQWNAIRPFQSLILQGCEHRLQSLDLSYQEAGACLAVLLLLGGGSIAQVQARMLALRTNALREILRSDEPASSIRNQVCSSLKLTVQTLELLESCFQGSGTGSVVSTLDSIVSEEAPPVSSLLDCMNEHTSQHLPPIIKNFRPRLAQGVEMVSPGQVAQAREMWLEEVKTEVAERLGALLCFVSSVHGVHAIREAAHASMMGQSQAGVVWELAFRPLLTSRVRSLVSHQLQQVSHDLHNKLENTLRDLATNISEQDLRSFVWREEAGDLPSVGGWMARTLDQAGGLMMKSLGYSPSVQRLCRALDSQLQLLLDDLMLYVSDGKSDITCLIETEKLRHNVSFDKFIDRPELQSHLQECTKKCIHDAMTFVKSQAMSGQGEVSLILLGRFLQAMCDLCPNLQRCMSPTNVWEPTKGLSVLPILSAEWQQLAKQLEAESLKVLQAWAQALATRLGASIAPLVLSIDAAGLLQALPQWEVVKIEEEGEAGLRVTSNIRVPSQPSLALQGALHTACQQLNLQAPHALPRAVHQELVESLVSQLLANYESIPNTMPQVLALQALFDVRFISSLLILRDSKILSERCQSICETLESKIDPFDLDVFQPYLQSNIKKSVHRTQHVLGCLVPAAKLAVLAGTRLGGGSEAPSPDDPTALPLCTGAPWFPLLPVATPGLAAPPTSRPTSSPVRPAEMAGTKPKKTISSSKAEPTLPSHSNLVRSGAAALFGAMSSEWFGSS